MSKNHDPEVHVPPRRGEGSKPFVGTWRITKMEVWSQEDVDLCGPGHLTFRPEGHGSMSFIAVEGELDCRFGKTKAGKPIVRFSWNGSDDGSETSGRGWAILTGEKIRGRIFFHFGDDSGFTAKREEIQPRAPRPRRRRRR